MQFRYIPRRSSICHCSMRGTPPSRIDRFQDDDHTRTSARTRAKRRQKIIFAWPHATGFAAAGQETRQDLICPRGWRGNQARNHFGSHDRLRQTFRRTGKTGSTGPPSMVFPSSQRSIALARSAVRADERVPANSSKKRNIQPLIDAPQRVRPTAWFVAIEFSTGVRKQSRMICREKPWSGKNRRAQ